MTIRKLLVFGATGTQGHPVVEEALAAGLEVRAVTRNVAAARARLTPSAEFVRADLLDADSVVDAMTGCQAVFFHLNHMPDTDEAQQTVDNVLAAARAHELERMVFTTSGRSEEHTSELQSRGHLVCRLLLEKKNKKTALLQC